MSIGTSIQRPLRINRFVLTFLQFNDTINEAVVRLHEEEHLGFLHAKTGKQIKGDYNNDALDNHHGIALKHKLTTDRHNPTADAVRRGHVRYYHHPEEHEAGYEFVDSPKARQHVANHLGTSGGFRHIYIDQCHPSGHRTSHEFNSVEAARNHLEA